MWQATSEHLESCHPDAWVQTPILFRITSVMLDKEDASVDSESGVRSGHDDLSPHPWEA